MARNGVLGQVARYVGESSRRKAGFAILHFDDDGRLARDFVRDVSCSQGDKNVVVVVAMHERCVLRRDLRQEHADLLIFEEQMVVRLGGDRRPRRCFAQPG